MHACNGSWYTFCGVFGKVMIGSGTSFWGDAFQVLLLDSRGQQAQQSVLGTVTSQKEQLT